MARFVDAGMADSRVAPTQLRALRAGTCFAQVVQVLAHCHKRPKGVREHFARARHLLRSHHGPRLSRVLRYGLGASLALVVFVVLACLLRPSFVLGGLEHSCNKDTSQLLVNQFAFEAYTHWAMETGRSCPESAADLLPYLNRKTSKDLWGNEYVLFCDVPNAEEVSPFVVISKGPDGELWTNDDIRSK